jgi:predicted nucleic acid-binding protein
MNGKPFLDTNIIVYAFSSNDPRNARAEALLEAGGVINVQVLNEFVNVSRRNQGRSIFHRAGMGESRAS